MQTGRKTSVSVRKIQTETERNREVEEAEEREEKKREELGRGGGVKRDGRSGYRERV